MIHKPILFKNISLSFPHKTCFADFNEQIPYGSRIAIMGRNGSGKSTLLQMILRRQDATEGSIKMPDDVSLGYVPQIIDNPQCHHLSGGQRLNVALTQALSINPNILLLDEPTNHLDRQQRKGLMRLLMSYSHTLIIVTHDTELLRNCVDTLWHIDNGHIKVFSGNYDDYQREWQQSRVAIERDLNDLDKQKKNLHHTLMQEQKRAASSKAKGKKSIAQRKWPTITSCAKASRASSTAGRNRSAIDHKKQDLLEQRARLHLPEIIVPTFKVTSAANFDSNILSISDGAIAYENNPTLLNHLYLTVNSRDRIAIQGNNASGKSSLIKAIMDNTDVIKKGYWNLPKLSDIGYLDQHYSTLANDKTVFNTIAELKPSSSHLEVRRHLMDFLFRKNEEVNAVVAQLSGGEKARLTLAVIAAKPPKLLILDEITNNLDLETREHVIEVLKDFPGAMMVISHDNDFLRACAIQDYFEIREGTIHCHP